MLIIIVATVVVLIRAVLMLMAAVMIVVALTSSTVALDGNCTIHCSTSSFCCHTDLAGLSCHSFYAGETNTDTRRPGEMAARVLRLASSLAQNPLKNVAMSVL